MGSLVHIKGRTTVHHKECRYISRCKQDYINIEEIDIAEPYHFCGICCKEEIRSRQEYYVILDLEMCQVPRRSAFSYKQETIQIGAVKVNTKFEIISEFCTYVHPEYGELDYRISRMTGIKESQLRSAPYLEDALSAFIQWIGDKTTRIYAWSDSDYNQFYHEITKKNLLTDQNQAFLDRNWINYQKMFKDKYELGRDPSLEEALDLTEIEPEGSYHNGLDDAANTARLIQKIELNPDYVLAKELIVKKNSDDNIHPIKVKSDALSYSIGEKFAAVFQQIGLG